MNNFLAAGVVVVNSAGNEGERQNETLGCINNSPFNVGIPYNVRVPGNIPSAWLHPDQPAPLSTDSSHVSAVITVGSTDENDDIMDHSSRGPATWEDIQEDFPCQDPISAGFWDYLYLTGSQNPLLKPDVTAPGNWCDPFTHVCEAQKFFTTGPNNSYEDEFGGTSSSAPLVAGTIALMLQANPDLTPAQVSEIIQTTAVDLGTTGKDNEYGAGRIDAYKAVKYTLENYGGTFSGEGNLTGDWEFQEDITVASTATLTLEPGVTLKFASGVKLTINGSIQANGTASDSITFTSAEASPAAGDWSGIWVQNASASSSFDYCVVEYSGNGIRLQSTWRQLL